MRSKNELGPTQYETRETRRMPVVGQTQQRVRHRLRVAGGIAAATMLAVGCIVLFFRFN